MPLQTAHAGFENEKNEMQTAQAHKRPTRLYWRFWKKVNEDRVKRMMNKELQNNRQAEQMMREPAK